MKFVSFAVAFVCFLAFMGGFVFADEPAEISDKFGTVFAKYDAEGTIVVLDMRAGERKTYVHNPKRAQKRFTPASTFKIPHTLFALDAGVVKDEFQVFPWDGVRRTIGVKMYDEIWNRDQTLQTGLRYSVVWFYQNLARKIGLERERVYLEKVAYGNRKASDVIDDFWLDGSLTISAHEQTNFLERLYRNALPFEKAHQLLVKDLMVTSANHHYKVRSKTGWAEPDGQAGVGWNVGWVETNDGVVFFALNIHTKNGMKDLSKRIDIAVAVLKEIGSL